MHTKPPEEAGRKKDQQPPQLQPQPDHHDAQTQQQQGASTKQTTPSAPQGAGDQAANTTQGERDEYGRFVPGCTVGAAYRWRPGQTGNPKGRPRTRPITDWVRSVLEAHDRAAAEQVARAFIKHAVAGKHEYAKLLLDRIEGVLTTKTESTTTTVPWEERLRQLEREAQAEESQEVADGLPGPPRDDPSERGDP